MMKKICEIRKKWKKTTKIEMFLKLFLAIFRKLEDFKKNEKCSVYGNTASYARNFLLLSFLEL